MIRTVRAQAGMVAEFPEFVASRWMRGGHRMTLASLLPRKHRGAGAALERRLVRVDAETQVVAVYQSAPGATATILFVHGLTGCSESAYMIGAASNALAVGLHTVRLNIRNCGGTEHLTPTLYRANLTADIEAVARALRAEGHGSIVVVGWSLGGNMALRLAAELGEQDDDLIAGIVTVSPAIDLPRCANAIDAPGSWFYRRYFLRELRRKMRRKASLFPGRFDVARLRGIETMREFDDRFTAPDGGYVSAADYYSRASALPVLESIRIPVCILASRDDPLVPFTSFDDPRVQDHPHIRLVATDHGGHCGFFAAKRGLDASRWWAEHRVVDAARWILAG